MKKLSESNLDDFRQNLHAIRHELSSKKVQIQAISKEIALLEKEEMYFMGIAEYLEEVSKKEKEVEPKTSSLKDTSGTQDK